MKFGTGQSWESQSTPQMKMQAAKEFAHPPPAITRKVQHTLQEVEYLITHALDQAELQEGIISEQLVEAHNRQLWREGDYESFADWVQKKWGKSKAWAYRMMQAFVNETCLTTVDKVVTTKVNNQPVTDENKAKSISISSRQRPLDNDDYDPYEEKPAVHAATPEQVKAKSGPTGKPSENGKPKSQLAIWTHVHDSYGALLRDVDRLHNLAPKESLHNEVLTLTKRAMECIRKWQSEV